MGGTGTMLIDRKRVATGRIERAIPFIFGAETADVGMDLYTPVTSDYEKGRQQIHRENLKRDECVDGRSEKRG